MLAVSGGRLICLSTPHGRRGFFWDAWANGGQDLARIEVTADRIPRIAAEFLEKEKRCLGEAWLAAPPPPPGPPTAAPAPGRPVPRPSAPGRPRRRPAAHRRRRAAGARPPPAPWD